MKSIDCSQSKKSVTDIVDMLLTNGILASNFKSQYSESEDAIMNSSRVYIHLNKQYKDAVSLLKNPKHKVKSALTKEQLNQIISKSNKRFYDKTHRFFEKLASILIILIILIYIVFVFIIF